MGQLPSWKAVREHLFRHYRPIADTEGSEATYAVVDVRSGAESTLVFAQPRDVAGRARLILIARICSADEVVPEVVLANGGATSAGALVVLDGSIALRYVGSLATMTADELDASLALLAAETRGFHRVFAAHRSTVAKSAASTMAHWI